MKMNGKTYDVLKFVVWLYVPLMTLATTILGIWFPGAAWLDPVRDTLIAINVFLGAIVSKSNYDYNNQPQGDDWEEEGEEDEYPVD